MIRVLQVVTQMHRAGLETMLMNYYREIDRQKIQFDFLVHRDGTYDYDDEICRLGGRIFHISPITVRGFTSYLKELNHFFSVHTDYKIVHCHLDAFSGFALRAAKRAGVPYRIAHSHNNGFDKNKKYPIKMLSKKTIPLYATHFWACSPEALKFMFPRVRTDKNTAIIPNAISTKQFLFCRNQRQTIRKELNVENLLVVGHIGRFCYQKNQEFVVEVFAQLHQMHPESVLLFIGTGDDMDKIRHKVHQYALTESVRFLGVRNDVSSLLSAMDVFLLPSFFEGFGIVLLEAQANGLPCVAADTISPFVNVSGTICWKSLKNSALQWAQELLRINRKEHIKELQVESFEQSEFDIAVAARKLENRYICMAQSIGEDNL